MKFPLHRASFRRVSGFTLIEMLTSMAILGVLSALLFAAFNQASKAWLQGESRVETFSQARATLDFMAQELSQAIQSSNVNFHGLLNEVDFVAPLAATNCSDLCQVQYVYTSTPPIANPYPTWMITRHFTAPTSANIPAVFGGTTGYWNPASPTWWTTWDPKTDAVLASNCVLNMSFTYYDQNGNAIPLPYGNGVTPNTNLPRSIFISMDVIDSRTAAALATLGVTNAVLASQTVHNFSRTVFFTTQGN